MNFDNNDKKYIEVITGNCDNLDISPAQTYIPASKPKIDQVDQRKIIIPKESK